MDGGGPSDAGTVGPAAQWDRLIEAAEAAVDVEWGDMHLGIMNEFKTLRDQAACLMVLGWVEKGHFLGKEDGAAPPYRS